MSQENDYFERLHLGLQRDSDRSVAIVAAALLDEALANSLKAKLLPAIKKENCIFSSPQSPLGSFSSRIDAAFQLGLISKHLHRDLHLIRKIRNDFAHNPWDLNFEDPKIKSRVIELEKVSNYKARNPESRDIAGPEGARYDFIFSVGWRLYSLNESIPEIKQYESILMEFGYFDEGKLPSDVKKCLEAWAQENA